MDFPAYLDLHAKDRLIKYYGNTVLLWKLEFWQERVDDIVCSFTDDDLLRLVQRYEEKYE